MLHLLSFLLLFAPAKKNSPPKPPPPTCPCELHDWKCRTDNPVCAEQQPKRELPPAPTPTQEEELAPIQEKPPAIKYNSLKANGGYALISPAGVAASGFSYMWGLDVGGWIDLADPLSLGIGARFEHVVGYDMFRGTIPFRVAVSSDYFSLYALMGVGFATVRYYCVEDIYIECDRITGANIDMAAGILALPWRGLAMGVEPSVSHFYFRDPSNSSNEEIDFSFRVWIGWKFGRATK